MTNHNRFNQVWSDLIPGELHKPVIVSVNLYEGKWRLDIRHHRKRNGKYIPTKDGVNIPFTLTDKFIEGLIAVDKEARE